MKTIGKIFVIILACSMVLFLLICFIALIYYLEDDQTTWLNDKLYNSIEELHIDYKNACYDEPSIDYIPDEIVFTHCVGDSVLVVCTEKPRCCSKYDDYLNIYVVKYIDGRFALVVPTLGGIAYVDSAEIYMHNDYGSLDYLYDAHMQYISKEEKICYGFAYKRVDDTYDLYFDGNKMDEVKCVDPFKNEEFILCYATSNKVYNTFQAIVTPREKRHTFEAK